MMHNLMAVASYNHTTVNVCKKYYIYMHAHINSHIWHNELISAKEICLCMNIMYSCLKLVGLSLETLDSKPEA